MYKMYQNMLCPFQSDVLLSVDNGCFLCFLCSESLHVYAYTNVLIYSVFTAYIIIIYKYIYIYHLCDMTYLFMNHFSYVLNRPS